MKFTILRDDGREYVVESNSCMEAAAEVAQDCAQDEVFSLKGSRKRHKFYTVRGKIAYPVSAELAAFQLWAGGLR